MHLRAKLKTAGDRWCPEEKVWHVPFGSIRGDAELEERILKIRQKVSSLYKQQATYIGTC